MPPAPLITAGGARARAARGGERKAQELIAAPAGSSCSKKQEQAVEAQDQEGTRSRRSRGARPRPKRPRRAGGRGRSRRHGEGRRGQAGAPTRKAPTEGTLHRPAAKPGETREARQEERRPAFQEEAARRRALKLRGETTAARRPRMAPVQGGRPAITMRRAATTLPRRVGTGGARSHGARRPSPSPTCRTRCRSRRPRSSRP